MEKLFKLARLYTQQFPRGNDPYRLLREFLKNAEKLPQRSSIWKEAA